MTWTVIKRVIDTLYPPQCVKCSAIVIQDGGLCATCWREAPFISDPCCDQCGAALMGVDTGGHILCDACLSTTYPWVRGRSVFQYDGLARHLILRFKHGDFPELAAPLAHWMAQAAAPILAKNMIVAPVPLHWRRKFRRGYNQADLLAHLIAKHHEMPYFSDLLYRVKPTPMLKSHSREDREAVLTNAFRINPDFADRIAHKPVLLIDDVMTTGTTLRMATHEILKANASAVSILTLARAGKET
ncbi:MAG: ComF family protein [Halocynthiibacter sp.]